MHFSCVCVCVSPVRMWIVNLIWLFTLSSLCTSTHSIFVHSIFSFFSLSFHICCVSFIKQTKRNENIDCLKQKRRTRENKKIHKIAHIKYWASRQQQQNNNNQDDKIDFVKMRSVQANTETGSDVGLCCCCCFYCGWPENEHSLHSCTCDFFSLLLHCQHAYISYWPVLMYKIFHMHFTGHTMRKTFQFQLYVKNNINRLICSFNEIRWLYFISVFFFFSILCL